MDTPLDALKAIDKKEKTDIGIALVVVFLAGVMLWFYGLGHLTNLDPATASEEGLLLTNTMGVQEVMIDNRRYVPITAIPMAKEAIARPAHIAQKRVTSITRSKADVRATIMPNAKPGPTPATVAVMAVDVMAVDTTTKFESVVDSVVGTEIDSTAVYPKGNDELTAPVQEPDSNSVDQSCVIIVGAYGNSRNAGKMKRQLSAAGYAVFEVPFRTLTRVGVYAPCRIDELRATLKVIRKDFAADATVLEVQE